MKPETIKLNQIYSKLLAVFISLLLITACGSPATPSPRDEIKLQLKWVHQAQFAGFYVAQEEGYYAEENLAVTLVEGGPEINIIDQVVAGTANFGIDAPENLIVGRSQGQPVVAVAVIYRRSPLVFVTLASSGIKRPQDFLGRTAALTADGELQFEALLKRLNLDISQVEFKPYQYDHAPLYNGDVDITYAYATGGLIRMRQTGRDINLIWPSDYGLHLYSDTLFTTEQMIVENPELVERFVRATLKGWRKAIESSEIAVAATVKYAREADTDIQAQMMEASLPLIHTGEDQIGWMRPEIWQGMVEMLQEQELLKQPVDVNQVYTMQFLEAVYGNDAP